MSLEIIARKLINTGLSVIPIRPDGSKVASIRWEPYKDAYMTPDEIRINFANGEGIAAICGRISGGLECLDFDDAVLAQKFMDLLPDYFDMEKFARLPVQLSPSGGRHIVYRCKSVEGNQKLARINFNNRPKTAIETRGEGGYFLLAPSPSNCHPKKIQYKLLQGSLFDIPEISPEERQSLLELSKTLNEWIDKPKKKVASRTWSTPNADGELKPGADYNARGDFKELLEGEGWNLLRCRGDVEYWQRPGKNGIGVSATLNAVAPGVFYVFSSNAYPFEPDSGYDLYAAYTLLKWDGDYKRSTSELGYLGYGAPPKSNKAGLDAYHRTDTGNAEYFVDMHKETIRYCNIWQSWLIWDGSRWKRDESLKVNELSKKTALDILEKAWDIEDKDKRSGWIGHAFKMQSRHTINNMIGLARSDPRIAVTPNEFDNDLWLFNTPSGTLDLRSGEFYPHKKSDNITRVAGCEYQPDADCPNWIKFLYDIMGGDDELVNYLQRVCGYTLTGSIEEQVIFIPYGTGRNGKSTFLNIIKELVGDYGKQADTSTFTERKADVVREDLASLHNVRFVSAIESGEGRRLAENLVKQMTGGEPIRARFLYQDSFEFLPTFKPFLVTNHLPIITGTDEGIWRRIQLIPFKVTIPEEKVDRRLPDILRRELPGILNWSLAGCEIWQEKGLLAPESVTYANDAYRNDMDVLKAWLEDNCILGDQYRAKATSLYQNYKKWADESGFYPVNQRTFGTRLAERGFDKIRSNGWKWLGIGLVDDERPLPNFLEGNQL